MGSNEQDDLLNYVTKALDNLGLRFFVTGSFAGIIYGEYRITNDIDIVLKLKLDQVDDFLDAFPEDAFYVNRDSVIDAVRTRFQFNIIHHASMTKVDFIIGGEESHDKEMMLRARRIPASVDYDIPYLSPEDLLLKKLAFHKESGSERHLRDAVGILKKSGAELDQAYIEKWLVPLDIQGVWHQALKLASGG